MGPYRVFYSIIQYTASILDLKRSHARCSIALSISANLCLYLLQ